MENAKVQDCVRNVGDRSFMEAAMAASALASYADGDVSPLEKLRVEDILQKLARLAGQDTAAAIALFRTYTDLLAQDPQAAGPLLAGKISAIASDREAANLVAGIALSVSYADGQYLYVEKMQFRDVCDLLDLSAAEVEPVLNA